MSRIVSPGVPPLVAPTRDLGAQAMESDTLRLSFAVQASEGDRAAPMRDKP
ncbi:hypothetical protein R6V09_07125 [Streptomyces sp. W16]|uniref:hypothetical protein n=1 Tax=Streptomyces sp. W16 TaxID=3076631 RepID=UPI00295C2DCA|nr:hypothetical protein [Streptomyces sp. W16]MDV9169910.1 hypothetical protein [Streptomyces sp. W16]